MNPIAVALVVLSALLHALRNLFTKESGDKQIFLWWYSVFGLLFFSPLFLVFLHREGIAHPTLYAWCAGSGFIHFLYWLCLTRSYEQGDLSLVYPIMRSSPAVVLLFATQIFGEKVSFQGALGVLLVAFGVYIINMQQIAMKELLAPIRSIARERATQFAFLTLLTVSLYSLVDKMAVSRIHPLLFAFFHLLFGMLYYTPYILLTKTFPKIGAELETNKGRILANGVLGIFGYTMILVALTFERVSYVVGLRQMSIVFAVLMGSQLLKEKHRTIRLAGSVIIFSGAFLISLTR